MIIDHKEVVTSGRVIRIARLRAEHYEFVDEPEDFLQKLKQARVPADLFTFLQRARDGSTPKFAYHRQFEFISVLRLSTYDHWWKSQINDKTRNMVRRAAKKGVEIRVSEFNDEFVRGIKGIYDETPIRQGKPFMHYGKDLATLQADHVSYVDRSDFIGAWLGQELIGFIKLVHGQGISHCMQIIARNEHRDKAPMNAMLAKAVEICAQRQVPLLHYGLWSRRGLGDFKKHHAFDRFDLPRFFVPLNLKGRMLLGLKLHRKPADFLPDTVVDYAAQLRAKWNAFRVRGRQA